MPLLRTAIDVPLHLATTMVLGKQPERESPDGSGSGRSLPLPLLVASTLAAFFATLFSIYLIWKQLKNYRKPTLQRYVVRLLLMVPIYSIASVISLYSLQLADIIDLIRDLYEAFVIYCFFNLLIEYLGGERSLIVLLHGRRPQEHLFPVNLFLHDMDASDPYTFLALKRGVLQYVQVKPVLAVATLLLKAAGKYEEGKISPTNGYTWVSFTYNVSVFLSLYCLGMFWKCLNDDLKPFRVTSKFLCIKGIIFFSFWQGLGISIPVAAGLIKKVGPVYDPEYISMAIQDFMICLEMPLFAFGHAWAFSHTDYIDPFAHYAARLPVYYALRDCIGMYDVFSDSLTTVRGTGYVYQTFEPSEGVIHQPLARERRSKAGLRYTQGGKGKYWLPQRGTGDIRDATRGARHQGPLKKLRRFINDKRMQLEGHAPLTTDEAEDIVHEDPDMVQEESSERSPLLRHPKHAARSAVRHAGEGLDFFAERQLDSDEEAEDLKFDDPDEDEEDAYQRSRTLNFGDYAYPNIDVSREQARDARWQRDDEIVHRRRKGTISKKGEDGKGKKASEQGDASPSGSRKRQDHPKGDADGSAKGKAKKKAGDADAKSSQKTEIKGKDNGKDAEQRKSKSPWLSWDQDADSPDATPSKPVANGSKDEAHANQTSESGSPSKDPYGAVDLVIEDYKAEERERLLERRRGDPALRAGKGTRIFRKQYTPTTSPSLTPTTESAPKKLIKRESSVSTPLNPPSSTAASVTVQPSPKKDGKVVVQLGESREKRGDGTDDDALVSKRIDVNDNADFLKGRVLSPEPSDKVDEDDGSNPWS
ncbi:Organic solute transporter Ost-alpha [Kalmanozyma brasiliensis GHG001]|uniref:DUF300-domain-containing protein n=1 Tax=Kalmanozyma brasiliensis (strain GHG001) TaxID=1365824 RepID=V5GSS8_KALBG|nr:Organic solute transporter Ost-alpha [Kalmanozyma brasiliensis GHG001]EST08982.1 Organic solute transporter Ost-alpha [Kalmanozyma brasiliensis GHG001]